MAVNELSRAVALKALAADVAARIRLGEKPAAIRKELLAEGYPPEVLDHVFSECESVKLPGRKRTVLAAVLSAVLLLGLPTAGAICGGFGAVWAVFPKHQAEQEELERTCGMKWLADLTAEGLAGLVGVAGGFGLGLAVALPVVKALSAWSIDGSTTDEEADE
jgi:hypothetical protein